MHLKKAVAVGTKFCGGHHVTPGKEFMDDKNLPPTKFNLHTILKIHFFKEKFRKMFCCFC